jgi:hypothetical protein
MLGMVNGAVGHAGGAEDGRRDCAQGEDVSQIDKAAPTKVRISPDILLELRVEAKRRGIERDDLAAILAAVVAQLER